MVSELDNGLREVTVPYQQSVVIAAGTELLLVKGPLKPADLLLVSRQLRHKGSVAAQIALQDGLIAGTSGEESRAPAHCTHSQRVTGEGGGHFNFFNVPDLDISAIST